MTAAPEETKPPTTYTYDRIPYIVVFANTTGTRDVYGGVAELVVMESYLLKPRNKPSDTVVVFMHPIGGGAYLPITERAGSRRPPRHLLQQSIPGDRFCAPHGKGGRRLG